MNKSNDEGGDDDNNALRCLIDDEDLAHAQSQKPSGNAAENARNITG